MPAIHRTKIVVDGVAIVALFPVLQESITTLGSPTDNSAVISIITVAVVTLFVTLNHTVAATGQDTVPGTLIRID